MRKFLKKYFNKINFIKRWNNERREIQNERFKVNYEYIFHIICKNENGEIIYEANIGGLVFARMIANNWEKRNPKFKSYIFLKQGEK